MNLEIREYTKRDWYDLISISEDICSQSIKELVFSLMKEYNKDVLKMLLAVCENNVVGFIFGFILPSQTLIPEFMYIKPKYRHQGIAKKLLAELEKQSCCTSSIIYYHNSLHDFYQMQGYQSGENLEVAIKKLQ